MRNHQTLFLRTIPLAVAFAGLLAIGCGHPAAPTTQAVTAQAILPKKAPSGTPAASGWDLGTAVPHGATQSYEGLPKAWSPESMSFPTDFNGSQITSITVAGKGSRSPWIGFVRSSGYWDVVYRWQGQNPPPKTKYAVALRTDVITGVKGNGLSSARAAERLNEYPEKYVPASAAASYSGEPTVTPVQHDDAGYFLRVSTESVFGEVKQAEPSAPWEGSIVVIVSYGKPKPM